MRVVKMILLVLFFGLIASVATFCIWYWYASNEGRKKNFRGQLGTYILDIHKTALGDYSKDSNIYKNLHITFKADSSFTLDMKVPFIYDSIGKWKAGNMKEWNYLYFRGDMKINAQFTRPYEADSAIFFLINGTTPQDGKAFIQEIYFKKEN